MLSVLAVRFQRTYIHTSKMNWMQNFDVSVPFVEDVFGSISPADLARTLTTSDELDFARLSRGDIINEGPTLKHLVARWHALATAVWECCLALPDLSSYIQDCIQVSHWFFGSQYSLTFSVNLLSFLAPFFDSNIE